jgi:8-oxo-dGTP pyrophosphatase MutT (NUDIX family)
VSHPFPPEVVERARAIRAGELQPVPPRDAATVVLVRNGEPRVDGRLEIFLLRRVRTMAFAAGMLVFPGGKVDPADDGGEDLPAAWADDLTYGDAALLRRVVGAAIRETAEECGVAVTAENLRPLAHWVTPTCEPRRYDTRFLLAALPAGQVARVADGEADEGRWHTVPETLQQRLMPPTMAVCTELSGYPDVAAALAADRTVERIVPELVPDPDGGGDGWRFEVLPG